MYNRTSLSVATIPPQVVPFRSVVCETRPTTDDPPPLLFSHRNADRDLSVLRKDQRVKLGLSRVAATRARIVAPSPSSRAIFRGKSSREIAAWLRRLGGRERVQQPLQKEHGECHGGLRAGRRLDPARAKGVVVRNPRIQKSEDDTTEKVFQL